MTLNQAKQNRRKRSSLRISSLITAAWGRKCLATETTKARFGGLLYGHYFVVVIFVFRFSVLA